MSQQQVKSHINLGSREPHQLGRGRFRVGQGREGPPRGPASQWSLCAPSCPRRIIYPKTLGIYEMHKFLQFPRKASVPSLTQTLLCPKSGSQRRLRSSPTAGGRVFKFVYL